MNVAHDAKVGNTKDWCFLVLVDRDDVLGTLHTHHVLCCTRDASSDVDSWLYNLAGLAHLE